MRVRGMVREVWSGGQTGVDRAALDVARELGIPCGGWVPRGRLAEDGVIPDRYAGLRETDSADYSERTEANVRDADATLILYFGPGPTGGTLATLDAADRLGRPRLALDLGAMSDDEAARRVRNWLQTFPAPIRLNVAGPRVSQAPEAYARARETLRMGLSAWR
jgi:hypothetical protein